MPDGKQIQSITAQGLIYLDDEGIEQFIDFAQCFEKYVNSSEAWEGFKQLNPDGTWDEYKLRRKKWREVGKRNILTPPWADGPYIEFYTEPRIRFQFATTSEFNSVRQAVEKAGWRTFDLT